MPANQIALGLATYGRAFSLGSNHEIGSFKDWKPPPKGQYTQAKGFLAYFEICTSNLTIVSWHASKAKAPYGYNKQNSLWVGYDDVESMKFKVNEAIKKFSK